MDHPKDQSSSPRVVEGIVLDRDGTPLTHPSEPANGPQQPFAGLKLFKPSPLLIVGAVVAIPLILTLLLFVAAFMLLVTILTGKRPRIIKFSNLSGFSRR